MRQTHETEAADTETRDGALAGYDTLRATVDDRVATVTLDGPDRNKVARAYVRPSKNASLPG